jgi:hypothetical protein
MSSLNNNTLPLVYVKAERFRLFLRRPLPAHQSGPDFLLLQVGESRLTCQVDNPLSRILVNDSIFYAAAEAGQLEVPGSSVEDRQYQLDLSRIGLYTGVWQVGLFASVIYVFYSFKITQLKVFFTCIIFIGNNFLMNYRYGIPF